ncbi:3-isopropylmalate dehydratase small subunit [Alteribacter aurantiacus]|uniref:3-isopropylmalate dehydratase small subunit n=1 Tax=Alteribacter aurantiacus TaxID=254410 RepID=UPI0004149FF8|nr:3-isopropylmalate dehydratase small subunit [Alteribacter aurantiacus]
MEPIRTHKGVVTPLNRANVDTDQIIPKQFLKRIERQGFGQFLFYHWRFDDDGIPRKDFVLNEDKYENSTILVAGDNFGCGSSREHAPWSLEDYGFKVIIAPSFADIFYNNCVKNGILPVELKEDEVETLLKKGAEQIYSITVDLENQSVRDDQGFEASFSIPGYHKEMLLNGWDDISITLTLEEKITQFEQGA